MPDIELHKGDRRPFLDATLSDANGAVDVTGATIQFLLWDEVGTLIVDQQSSSGGGGFVTIQDATAGEVRYAWQAADTSTAFRGFAQWRVQFSDLTRASFPNTGNLLTFALHAGLST